ncbi:Arginyl-tRNA--protein transferase 1 [Apostasia shenzhenica]|uniref:Arginyl-tRNA--protein transferase n=1 Tax=Apostasia shenzhenica TaxID=1088818 RepID=A0A2I0AHS0_9ASPA|nr:Arginyl-tRNA--protein transferase 1 [Apostasia shenzhenica]
MMGDGASSSRGGEETVVIDHGRRRSSCGYCRSTGYTSISHGLWAQSITADDYQDLLDRGWRRSGCFLYKPEMERTCCPSYTIRLKAHDFVPSKEQIRVHKKMERFLHGTLNVRSSNQSEEKVNCTKCSNNSTNECAATGLRSPLKELASGKTEKKFKEVDLLHRLSKRIDDAVSACIERGEFSSTAKFPEAVVKKVKLQGKRKFMEDLLYSSNAAFQIAALLRRAEAEGNTDPCVFNASQNGRSLEVTPNLIAEKLASSIKEVGEPSGLLVKGCNGHLNFYSLPNQSVDLVSAPVATEAYVQTFEGVIKKNCSYDNISYLPPKKRKLEIRMKKSSFDPEEFALYKRYQIQVHGDLPEKVTESSYRRFLVDTPIIFVPAATGTKSVPPCGFGSFHQQYVIDGKLVAVGVVDILPRCLSSKYLFWDPDLAFLSLGKYSALQEINWVKETQLFCPSLHFYYLGYYIHSCSKMRYKAAYRPSELLCPLRYEWVPFNIVKCLLDKKPYVVLSDFANQQNEALSSEVSYFSNGTSSCPDSNYHNEASSDENEEVIADREVGEEDEDDKTDTEDTTVSLQDKLQVFDVSSIVIDLNGSRLRFKDLQQVFGPINKNFIRELELQLQRFVRVVGRELSSHLIYSLG